MKNLQNKTTKDKRMDTKHKILKRDNLHIYKNLKGKTDSLKHSRVLVTGSGGFLGKTIVSFLQFLNNTKFNKEEQINTKRRITYKIYLRLLATK